MKPTSRLILATAFLAVASGAALSQPDSLRVASRGELLYSLHCVACHSKEIHWRDKGVARDWANLVAEVDRWQKVGRLGWDHGDVIDTARYLNRLHYRYPEPEKP